MVAKLRADKDKAKFGMVKAIKKWYTMDRIKKYNGSRDTEWSIWGSLIRFPRHDKGRSVKGFKYFGQV